jgi:predicted permease
MWLVKGVLFGLLIFIIFTLIYFFVFVGPPRQGVATGLSVIAGNTVFLPLYWAAFILTMATSCVCARLLHMAFQQRPPL